MYNIHYWNNQVVVLGEGVITIHLSHDSCEGFQRFRGEQIDISSEERYDQPSTVFDIFVTDSLQPTLSRQIELGNDMKNDASIFSSLVVVQFEVLGHESVCIHPLGGTRFFEGVQYSLDVVILPRDSSEIQQRRIWDIF